MNLLLDTHLLLWSAFASDRLSPAAREAIADPTNDLWFSAVSLWEVAIKRSLDRPDFQVEPGTLRAGLLANGYREQVLTGSHCLGQMQLSAIHRDPFDRILVAQAQGEGLTLLTADATVARYPGPVRLV
ncbi:MAG: type II toxin-antitoxin system VapC family toxin [Pseudomonadota bacterium]